MPLLTPILIVWLVGSGAPALASSSGPTVLPAQEAAPTQPAPPEQPAEQEPEDTSDSRVNPAQPDFTVVSLPTTLPVPRHKSAFRVTHRFARPLGSGSFGDLVEDFFGFDAGAQIGLEYRFGLLRGTQIGIHRTSDKTIELFGQYDALRQAEGRPYGLAALVAIEGINNFKDEYAPTLGALLSHEFGRTGAVYLEPMWLGGTNPNPEPHEHPGEVEPHEDDLSDYTVLLGIGGRFRVRPTVYVVGEIAPRLAGYDPGVFHASFGIEKRAGGHSFQINFSNSLATTPAQLARGGFTNDNWYIGFNISRKFF